jgi:hypothetical protein
MRAAYKSGADVEEVAGALSSTQSDDFGFSDTQVQEMADQIQVGGSAMLALFEHTWAVGLKEAILNAGGETVVHEFLDPQALELGGTKLEDAVAAAQTIEMEADQVLADAQEQAAAKIAEAQQILAQAEADADAKIAQSQDVADAAIAASVREASAKLREADEIMEQSQPAAAE